MLKIPNQHKLIVHCFTALNDAIIYREKLPPNLRKDTLYALYMQGLAQVCNDFILSLCNDCNVYDS